MTDEFPDPVDDDRPDPVNGDVREPVNGGTVDGVNGDIPDLDLGIEVATPPELEDAELGAVLEALLLVVDTPVTVDALAAAIQQPAYRVSAKLQLMAEELSARESGIDLREAGGGWRMYTRAQYAPYVERLLLDGSRSKLTRAALETLAVVAYRQPVTRARVSAVRGVNVDAVMRTLLARGLITEAGTDSDTGAITFATTELFLERLGLSSLTDLPDIAPLLPDVDVIDDLSETLGDEPRFVKLGIAARRATSSRCPSTWTKTEMADSEGVRLQKVLSQAGIASRRVAEKMIIDGRVEVDGRVVTELGTRVDPDVSEIRVDGARVLLDDTLVHLALNKPRGMHSTMSDDRGRPCIGDLVEHRVRGNKKLFHVGRLDADTEGLMLLTNDGELAHRLMHPSFEVPKTYLATVVGTVPRGLGRKLRDGIELDDGPARVDDFAVVDAVPGKTMVRVTLHEGRKRIVRRLLKAVGFPVQELVRTDIGAVSLGDQRPGSIRVLSRNEIGALYKAVGL